MKSLIIAAFERSRDGFSVDRVICDPGLNAAFIAGCRDAGIDAPDTKLNRSLLNLRKAGHLRHIDSRRTTFANDDAYRFAAEMAARHMERDAGVTLDDLLCDPELAAMFDQLAARLSPGFTPLEYRWAALYLRKMSRLAPELLSRVAPPVEVVVFPVSQFDLDAVPKQQGLYLFFTPTECLYVGEAESLRNRIGKHLDHSDNKGLARWMWDQGTSQLFVELQSLAADTTQKVRRALETELIRSRNPTFNVKR